VLLFALAQDHLKNELTSYVAEPTLNANDFFEQRIFVLGVG